MGARAATNLGQILKQHIVWSLEVQQHGSFSFSHEVQVSRCPWIPMHMVIGSCLFFFFLFLSKMISHGTPPNF